MKREVLRAPEFCLCSSYAGHDGGETESTLRKEACVVSQVKTSLQVHPPSGTCRKLTGKCFTAESPPAHLEASFGTSCQSQESEGTQVHVGPITSGPDQSTYKGSPRKPSHHHQSVTETWQTSDLQDFSKVSFSIFEKEVQNCWHYQQLAALNCNPYCC